MKSKLRIYTFGGAGSNLAQLIDVPKHVGIAEPTIAVFDTSDANITDKHNSELSVFKVPGMDGAGASKKLAYEMAVPHLDQFLKENPEGEVNLIIFGASSASGSTVGPEAARMLMERDRNVICLVVTDATNATRARNSYATLATLQNYANKLKRPLPLMLYRNLGQRDMELETRRDSFAHRDVVDSVLLKDVVSIATMCSGEHGKVDGEDITTFLNYTRVNKELPGGVVDLFVVPGAALESRASGLVDNVIISLSLLMDSAEPELELNQPTNITGYFNPTLSTSINEIDNLHYVISNSFFKDEFMSIKEASVELAKIRDTLKDNHFEVEEQGENGLILD